jgi:hypothetical protein
MGPFSSHPSRTLDGTRDIPRLLSFARVAALGDAFLFQHERHALANGGTIVDYQDPWHLTPRRQHALPEQPGHDGLCEAGRQPAAGHVTRS